MAFLPRPFTMLVFAFVLSALIARPAVFAQGSLTPPGPPAPTMKTLDEVEPRKLIKSLPFVISERGSYYVTADLISASSNGISIDTSHVTVDLNGFTLRTDATGTGYGLRTNGSLSSQLSGITIRNGTLQGFQFGVYLQATSGSLIENVTSTDAGSAGFQVNAFPFSSNGNIFRNCRAVRSDNSAGFLLQGDSSGSCNGNEFLHCTASNGVAGQGFLINGNGGRVRANRFEGCTATGNALSGFYIAASSGRADSNLLIACTASGNIQHGFFLTSAASGSLRGNSLRGCVASINNLNGIELAGNDAAQGNLITENLCTANSQRGIVTTGSDGGLTVGNHCAANPTGNYLLDITDSNGPVVTTSGTLSTTGTDAHPWANFSR